ncbi:TonB-dependent receptor-like protein [Rhodothalassium salexigens DSM 2132]|uniref:TonB-dependent receptor-like protein n=1 Tax=Rhodothalassium salexigens DSM 2132 TaxID=1188247 RepID=A0A4V2SN57_RHOSA|nr:Plug domain-containing protein [Rhodothalassium salexigens]MBB4212785.1 outer membrane receptor protein involved in Fe transport [Rhodothalassium salexigens DSM 2132]TCP29906.1 TonB-dependent receptor-like protein [Rhodothalassium salexigens DSM 2132]
MRPWHYQTLVIISAALLSAPGYAQSTQDQRAEKDEVLDVIVVTGSKTPGVDLSRSAIGASVLSADELESARIDSVSDLTRALPNLSTQRLGQVGGLFLTVRGIASNPFVVNRVAVYVDDVPYRELNDLLLEDLERIEFLRGPQSALYGLN